MTKVNRLSAQNCGVMTSTILKSVRVFWLTSTPENFSDAAPDPNADRSRAERWFANHTGAGEAAPVKTDGFSVCGIN